MSVIRVPCHPAVSVLALLFALLAVPFLTRPAAATYGVPVPSRLVLTVRETAGVARTNEVVRSGVPLPRSLNVLNTSRLAVVDGAGRAVAADFQITARWNAGLSDTAAPIQWLMVSFPATVGARGSVTYRLVTDGSVANPAPARPLQVTQSGNAFTVDTGAAIFRFGADPGALFDEVLLANGTRLAGGGTLSLLSGGLSARHPTIRKVWVEHAGPLFAAVVVTGAYDLPAVGNGQISSIRRYVFTAGSPTAVIRHAVNWEGNLGCQGCVATSTGAPNGVRFDQIRDSLTVSLGSSPTVTAVGAFASPAVTASVPAGRTASVRQLLRGSRQDALRFQVDVNGTAASGVQATGGVLAASGPSGAVAIALDQMHRYEPQALRVLADGSLAVDVADDKVWVAHHQGLFATLAVSALAAGPSRATLDSQVWAPLNHPLRGWPDAAWFASSQAVEEFPVGPLPADLASYDTLLPTVFNRTVQQIDALGLAGLTTFGVYPRYWGKDGAPGEIDCGTSGDPTPNEAWDNKFWCSTWTDYHNTAATVPVWAMRSGQVEWLDDLGVPAALRTLHTQIMQCGPSEKWYYCGQAPAGYGAYRTDFNSSHAYFDNLYLYYWLTGDSTVVEILRRGGENARRNMCDTRGPKPVVEPVTGPGGPACAADYPSSTSEFTGRVATQWINAFRFLGLASPDGSFLDDYRNSLARAATQHYVEVHRAGETKTYGFLGERAVVPGTYIGGPIWMYGFYDTNTIYRLLRDTGDAPIGLPAMTPSHLLATVARTLKDIEPSVQGDGTVAGDWPKNLEYTYLDSRIGGTLADVIPNDRPIFTPEKCSVTALFLRAGELSGDASLINTGTDMVHFTLSAAAGEEAPLGKLEGQDLGRLHAAIAHLVNTGGAPPPPPPPSAPSALTAQAASDTAIQLTWQDGSNNEDGFSVEKSINGTFQEVQTLAANSTGATITGLAAGTSYTFRVRAFNDGGNSSYTNSAGATTTAPAPGVPAAPSDLVAVAVSSTDIQLTWKDNSDNETNFLLERLSNGTFVQFNMRGSNVTSFRVTGLTPGTQYTFRVRAKNTAGNSGYTNNASATTLP
jgi:chitodextrinase